MRKHLWILVFSLIALGTKAQMDIDGQLLFGNEWIDYDKTYLKISLEDEGIYKIGYQDLLDNGIPIDQINGADLQLFYFGNEVPIHTSNEGQWGIDDYLVFYGKRNDGSLDKHLYKDWEQEQLNPDYSLFTDNSNYFLTWEEGVTHERYNSYSNNLTGNLPDVEDFYMHSEKQIFFNRAWTPVAPQEPKSEFSSFIVTEGFGDIVAPNHTFEFPVKDVYIFTGQRPMIRARTGSNRQPSHIVNVMFNGDLVDVDTYNGNQIRNYEYEIKLADLTSTSVMQLEAKGISDNIIVGSAELVYPRQFIADNAESFSFEIQPATEERYFEIQEFNGGVDNFLFDIENNRVTEIVVENGVAKAVLPPTTEESKLIFINGDSQFKNPLQLSSKSFENLQNLNFEYLILTSELLNNSDNPDNLNPVSEYAAYRNSPVGGGYETGALNVESLYGLFAYGIDNHSLAVKNFSNYAEQNWSDFQFAFIIGKGLSYIHRNRTNVEFTSFVPSYGKPGSDNLMFSKDTLTYPFVAVGRLAAHNQEDILNYLEKVKAHDLIHDISNLSIEERKWTKNVLHLSGGDDQIKDIIYGHLTDMENIIENNKFGANVTTFRKTSSDPVQTSLSQSIIDLIDDGTSIITFFGHSSAGTFDFSIEDPEKYNNKGRYPVVQSLGCHSGDIHESVFSLSERFILTKDKGAVAFVASSGNAFLFPLGQYGKAMYSEVGEDFYGRPIGIIIQKILEEQYNGENVRSVTLHQQNTLHGDPAVRLFEAPGPDYVVDFPTVSTMGDVGTFDEHINLSFDIINLGTGTLDSLDNYIVHEYGNNQSDTFYFRSNAPFNRENHTCPK